jgi:hypothetical protein
MGDTSKAVDPAAGPGIDDPPIFTLDPVPSVRNERPALVRWLVRDIPYIAMLLLAAIGVGFRLPVTYWLILFPLFGIISAYQGRDRQVSAAEQAKSVLGIALIWIAMLVAIYLLYSSGVKGVINSDANSLIMIILLALGTFCAGVQARIWQICTIGVILFLAVPALGWLDQSFMFISAAALIILVVIGAGWWGYARWRDAG